mgnify:CR=1 FL=1
MASFSVTDNTPLSEHDLDDVVGHPLNDPIGQAGDIALGGGGNATSGNMTEAVYLTATIIQHGQDPQHTHIGPFLAILTLDVGLGNIA